MIIWRMRIACLIPKATKTHSEYVTLFFRCNNVLHELASIFRFTYIASFVLLRVFHPTVCSFSTDDLQNVRALRLCNFRSRRIGVGHLAKYVTVIE